MLYCALCQQTMAYVHGHAACVDGRCPMYGVNQAECCDGEQVSNCPVPTSTLRAAPATRPDDRDDEV